MSDVAHVNMVASYFYETLLLTIAAGTLAGQPTMLPMSTPGYNAWETDASRQNHHGNLRKALLEGAIRLIAEVGLTAFTLREVARRAGVSPNAPYRHFRDRNVMAAVAAQGFRELTHAMNEAAAPNSDALERLKSAGLGYVMFALRRPEHFTAMFDAPFSKRKHPDSRAAGEESSATLVGFVKGCRDAGKLPPGDLRQMALLAWTMVHGIAKLGTTGRLPFHSNSQVLKFAEFVIDHSLPVAR